MSGGEGSGPGGSDGPSASDAALLASIVAEAPDAIVAVDPDLRVVVWNDAATGLFGPTAAEAVGRRLEEVLPRFAERDVQVIVGRALAGEVLRRELVWTTPDGRVVDIASTTGPIRDDAGRVIGVEAAGRDITELRRADAGREVAAERALLLAEATRLLARTLDVGSTARVVGDLLVPRTADLCSVRALRPDGSLETLAMRHVDPEKEALASRYHALSADPKMLVGSPDLRVLETGESLVLDDVGGAPADRDPARAAIVARGGLTSIVVVPLRVASGVIGTMALGMSEGRGPLGPDDVRFLEELGDRTAQALENARLFEAERESAARARAAEARFRAAFDGAPVGMAVVAFDGARNGVVSEVNNALCQLFGCAREELLGIDHRTFMHPEEVAGAMEQLRWLLDGDVPSYAAERRYLHRNGEVLWLHLRAALLSPAETPGGPVEVIIQAQDVTERRRYEHRLQHLADHDALTGLYNRRRFHDELDRVVDHVRRYPVTAGVIVLDLDGFKEVNDGYGHAVGDELLRRFASALRQRLRRTDIVGRLGGDEFGVLLPQTDAIEARALMDELLETIRADVHVQAPGGRIVSATASAGLRLIDAQNAATGDQVLIDADIAMYDAKQGGRDRASVAGHGSAQPDEQRARLGWSERIRDALAGDDGFLLYEQPILALASGRIERSEILVRMPGVGGGEPVAPGVFLPVAERFGHIQALDRWVARHAIHLLADRQACGHRVGLEVNLSGGSISDPAVIDFIASEVRNAAIDPTLLTFEVTETAAIVNVDRARRLAQRLADLGCQFALDDFGSGFGSFSYLKLLPFDLVKIDGDFIRELTTSHTDRLTVQAIVQIAQGLGKPTVAEFVGDEPTVDLLRSLGVDHAQGYHVGRPRPALAEPAFLAV